MTKRELIERGCLVPDTLAEARNEYSCEVVSGTEKELKDWLNGMVEENGIENTYLDFYYWALTPEEQQRVRQLLTEPERSFVENFVMEEEKCEESNKGSNKERSGEGDKKQVYFRYEPELFDLAFRLSVREYLFSSFYFSKTRITVWGNYERKFILIRK